MKLQGPISMVLDEAEELPEGFSREDVKRGHSSAPMYSNTWSNPAERRAVKRRNWRKQEEDYCE